MFACLFAAGQFLPAEARQDAGGGGTAVAGPVPGSELNQVKHLRELPPAEQLRCLEKLKEAGAAAVAELPALCDLLEHSDGATDHLLIAAVLNALRPMGRKAAPAAETLSRLLPHRNALYRDRDKMVVVRLRAYLMVTLSEIGFPASAVPPLLDSLAHMDPRMMALEAGASVRAAASLGRQGRRFIPYLLEALSLTVSEVEISLERYDPLFPPEEATTVQLEAVRALGLICTADDRPVLEVLRQLAAATQPEQRDRRVVRQAAQVLARLESTGAKSSQPNSGEP